ncbi:dihydroneopterin aldolase [Parapedobacter tibetensis]|uniref:dihydroneopterin aldolase n=1 Tax=Parapedobacter tibetensis TaxID=2972951 RepID=UPI00214DAF2F|nr:dihydroneopterin aldolase [Parapedobacter tibetensis]
MEHIRQQVALTDLRFYAFHGYYPEEQVLGNEFVVDMKVEFDRDGRGRDDLNDTVNYETLHHIAMMEMKIPRKLLETVAETMLNRIRKGFPFVDTIEVKICKTQPPFGGDKANASITLVWKR